VGEEEPVEKAECLRPSVCVIGDTSKKWGKGRPDINGSLLAKRKDREGGERGGIRIVNVFRCARDLGLGGKWKKRQE